MQNAQTVLTSFPESFSTAQLAVVAAFRVYVENRFRALTVNTLDRAELYWHDCAARWAREFGASKEAETLAQGMKLPDLARVLCFLPTVGFSTLIALRANESGFGV